MNLTIKQSTNSTENLTSPNVVETLYQLTKPDPVSGLPAADAVLVGRIQVPVAYEDSVDFLNTQFSAANSDNGSDFQVTVPNNNYYIRFVDPAVESVIKTALNKAESEGVTTQEAAATDLRVIFKDNTNIVSFSELKYFTTALKDGAFTRCSNLEEVDISNRTIIPKETFYQCRKLKKFSGPNSVEGELNLPNLLQISGINPFEQCYQLTTIISLGQVTKLPGSCFKSCTAIDTVYQSVFDKLTTIDRDAFSNCPIEHIIQSDNTDSSVLSIPNLTGNLGSSAFSGAKITEVSSLGSITSIGNNAFENCTNLATINFPNTVTSVEGNAFNNTAWLNNQPTGPVYINNVLYKYKVDSAASYTAPSNVTYITAQAFKGCTNLTSVDLSNLSITSLDSNTFENCENLQTAVLPNTITSLGNNIFYRCHNLETVNIPSGVTTLKDGLFRDCNKLQSVTIPNSVTKIERLVFASCDLLSIHIPALVTSFDVGYYSTFSSNKNCTVITVDSNNAKYDSRDNCNAIIETANNKLVWGCAGTVIPSSVTSIGDYAFQSMLGTAVTAFTIPSNVDTIGSNVFNGCIGLVSLTVERVTPPSVGTTLFSGQSMSVPDIYVPRDSVTAYKTAPGWSSYASKIQAIPT